MQRRDEKILEPKSERTDDIKPTRGKQQEERDLFELKGNVTKKQISVNCLKIRKKVSFNSLPVGVTGKTSN